MQEDAIIISTTREGNKMVVTTEILFYKNTDIEVNVLLGKGKFYEFILNGVNHTKFSIEDVKAEIDKVK